MIGVIIKGDRVYRVSDSGLNLGSIGSSGSIAVGCDNNYAVILYKNGRAYRYSLITGSQIGQIGPNNIKSIVVANGILIVSGLFGSYRYSLTNGANLGSL